MKNFELYANEWDSTCDTQEHVQWAIYSTPKPLTEEEFRQSGEQFVKDEILQHINPKSICVDFGCGIGRITDAIAPHVKTVVGIDVSSKMIERAKSFCKSKNIEWYCGSYPLPLRDCSVDLIVSHLVLQHMDDVDMYRVMHEAYRALKPKGIFLATFTSFTHDCHQQLITDLRSPSAKRASRVRGYTVETILTMINHIGFYAKFTYQSAATFMLRALKPSFTHG